MIHINIISKSKTSEIVSIHEMESNEKCWNDWINCDNEYSVNDRKAIKAGREKYPFVCTTSLEIIQKIEELLDEIKIKKFAVRGYIISKELMIGKHESRLG